MTTFYKLVSGEPDDDRYVIFETQMAAEDEWAAFMDDGYPHARVEPVEMEPAEFAQLCKDFPVESASDVW